MDQTILLQGSFISDGEATVLNVASGVMWIETLNYTQMATTDTPGVGVKFEWQLGMPQGGGIAYTKSDGTNVLNGDVLASGGFTLIDTSINNPGTNVAITAVSTAAIPVVSTANTQTLSTGSGIVRLYNTTGAPQLGGYDFTVGTVVANTSFTLAYMAQLSVAATAGSYRIVPYQPMFYPPYRYITKMSSSGSNTLITLSVTHEYLVGQEVRVIVPVSPTSTTKPSGPFGMPEINGLQGTIVAIDTAANTITLDIDSSAFTAFSFPTVAQLVYPFSPAMVVPVGQDTGYTLQTGGNILSAAMNNVAIRGVSLAGGADSPGGADGDLIYWKIGVSFSNDTP